MRLYSVVQMALPPLALAATTSVSGLHIAWKRYVDVVKWDDGYLVVLAKYSHNAEPEEEYIDLKPILEGLYIDSASFLKSIKSVRIAYA